MNDSNERHVFRWVSIYLLVTVVVTAGIVAVDKLVPGANIHSTRGGLPSWPIWTVVNAVFLTWVTRRAQNT